LGAGFAHFEQESAHMDQLLDLFKVKSGQSVTDPPEDVHSEQISSINSFRARCPGVFQRSAEAIFDNCKISCLRVDAGYTYVSVRSINLMQRPVRLFGSLLGVSLITGWIGGVASFASAQGRADVQSPAASKTESKSTTIEVSDWKEPPKSIPWSEIVTIKSPFETFKAVWDQDYQGRSCFISCDYYDGFISRWTGDQLAVAEFSSHCLLGGCRKRFRDIPYGIEILIDGEMFSLSGSEGLYVLSAKVRKALQSSAGVPKISLRLGGSNSSIYNIGPQSAKSIKSLVNEEALQDQSVRSGTVSIQLSPAIAKSDFVQPIIKRTLPGVAEISTPRGKGTGFLIDSKGLLLTNRHVVGRFPAVDVRFSDNRSYRAKVIGRTSDLDIALLQIEGAAAQSRFSALPLCIQRTATVGEDIIVIGNPMGLQATTTRGIVSGVRNEDGSTMLQIDAPVNPGNSGGPIVNYSGEVIGVVTTKLVALSVEGIGFGISLPSALESLGVKVTGSLPLPQPAGSRAAVTNCGNSTI
jgi:S1-C subfamily serine protease